MKASEVKIVEVGLRDGLQNEKILLDTNLKFKLLQLLLKAGLCDIEVGAYVRSDKVPAMADTALLLQKIHNQHSLIFKKLHSIVLVPNQKGLDRFLEQPANELAVFTATSETFTEKNIGMTIQQSLTEYRKMFERVFRLPKKQRPKIRGYISTAMGCPYEGKTSVKKLWKIMDALWEMGADEISIGDTIGVGVPKQVKEILQPFTKDAASLKTLALHCHDTRGTALANVFAAYEKGVRIFDSSVGGLGGCPYAPGASGNLATEDLIYAFHKSGIKTSVQEKLFKQLLQFLFKQTELMPRGRTTNLWL